MKPRAGLRLAIFASVLTLVALVSYFPSLDNFFWSDDLWRLNHARKIASDPSLALEENTPYFRPIGNVYLAAVYPLVGVAPGTYRIAALGIHVFNALLLAMLATRLSGSEWSGYLAGLVLAVAWVHYEVIYWVSAVNDLIAAALLLGTALCYVRHLDTGRRSLYAMSLVLAAGSLLTKESAVVLPVILLLVHLKRRRTGFNRLLPFFGLVAVLLGLEHVLGLFARHGPKRGPGLHMPGRLLQYASHLLTEPLAPWRWVKLAAACALFLPLGVIRKTRSLAGLGAAWFLVALLPAAQWRYMEVQSRWCYLPMAGLALWLSCWGLGLTAAGGWRRAVGGVIVAAIAAHNIASLRRVDALEHLRFADYQGQLIRSIRSWVEPRTEHIVVTGCQALLQWQVEDISDLYFGGRLVRDDNFPIEPHKRASTPDTLVFICREGRAVLR